MSDWDNNRGSSGGGARRFSTESSGSGSGGGGFSRGGGRGGFGGDRGGRGGGFGGGAGQGFRPRTDYHSGGSSPSGDRPTGNSYGFGSAKVASNFGGGSQTTNRNEGFQNRTFERTSSDKSGDERPRSFGDRGNQQSFGDRGSQGGVGDRGNQQSFGDRGSQGGFGDRGNQQSFGDRGNQGGFGDRGGGRGGFGGGGRGTGFGAGRGGGFSGGRGGSFGGTRSGGSDGGFNRPSNFDGGDRKFDSNNNKENGGNDDDPQKPREFYIPPEPATDESEIFTSEVSCGINFSKYDSVPVKVSGENLPQNISNFDEAGFRDILMDNIRKSGYKVPTPIQKSAIPVITSGRDLMSCAQTGSGKTASFLLPIINRLLTEATDMSFTRPQALVVSPTRELAVQIFNEARKFSHNTYIKVSVLYGGTSTRYQGDKLSKGCHILISTPGRLLDFAERGYVSFEECRFVVLDEADRMLDFGFKDDVEKIMRHKTMRKDDDRQNLMFSATFRPEVQILAGTYLVNYVYIAVGIVGGACTDVKQVILEVPKFEKRNKLMELLKENAEGTIVFVDTKRSADFLASILSETEYPTTSIHGDRLQSQRETALSDFKSGRMKVLIATSVAARGLDIRNIRHVINYDLPDSIDEYVHRIGRTGRLGNKGRATSFYDAENDHNLAHDLCRVLNDVGQDVPPFLSNPQYGGGYSRGRGGGFGGGRGRGGRGGGGGGRGGGRFYDRDVRPGQSKSTHFMPQSGGPSSFEPTEDWD